MALGIDLSIRRHFPGKSLDDWMKTMWREHPDADQPYNVDDLQTALAHATGDKAFAEQIFHRHIYGKEPMPYADLLAYAGMALQKRPGGAPWIGNLNLAFSDRGADIGASTLRDSPLYNAGLDRGDAILQWDGKTLKSQAELTDLLESHKPGDKIHLRYESRGGRKETDVTLAEAPQMELTPYELTGKELTPEMAAFRDAWLGNKALHPLPKLVKYCPVCKRSWTFEYEMCPYDGGTLQITIPKPGDEKRTAQPQAPGGRGGRGGRGGGGGGQLR